MKHVPCVCKVWSLCLMGELLSVMASAATIAGAPDCYLDYIESTGTQYIDTGVNAETGLRARVDFSWEGEIAANTDKSMLDAATVASASDKRSRVFLCHIFQKKPFFGYGLQQRGNPSGTFEFVSGQRCEIVSDITGTDSMELCQNGKKTFSSGDREKYAVNGNVDLGLNLFLFACNYGGNPNWKAAAKLYECKIFKKNASTGELKLLRHFLPAKKNGHVGLYDKATGFFYYDADNEFVAGDVLDKPLALVESLTSDGAGDTYQCFNTWVWGKSGLRSEVDFSPLYPTGDRGVLACRETDGDTRLFMAYTYETAFRFATGKLLGKDNLNVVAPATGKRYVIKTDTTPGAQSMTVSANGGEAVEVLKDGVDYGSDYMATTNTLSLLATHRAYDNNFATPVEGTLYATKIWDSDGLLRDFVPAVATNSAGVLYAGLYDKVTERIYKPLKGKISSERDCPFDLASQVGPVTNVLVTVDPPKTRLEYVDSDGVADYIDLGVAAKDGIEMDAVMEWLAVPSDGAFVGARTDLQNNHDNGKAGVRFFPYHHWQSGSSGHRIGYDGQIRGNDQIAAANTKYSVKSHLDAGDQWYTVQSYENGAWSTPTPTVTAYGGPVNTGLTLWLFAMNFDGTPKYYGHARVYSLKLRTKQQNGAYAPALNLVPVRDPLTGGAALWDKVGKRYYRSGGSFRLAGGGAERPLTPGLLIIMR